MTELTADITTPRPSLAHSCNKLEHAKVMRDLNEAGKMRYSQSLTEAEQKELRYFVTSYLKQSYLSMIIRHAFLTT